MVLGGTIGVGILRLPATIATYVTSPSLYIGLWIGGGLISLLGAGIYAELGTRFPKAGGPFVLVQQSMGNRVGFLAGWSDWIANVGSIAYLAVATIEYVTKLLGVNIPLGITSSSLIIMVSVIHWRGLEESSVIQKIMSSLKAIGLVLFIIACFVYFFQGHRYTESTTTRSYTSIPLFSALILSFRAVFTTYFGFNNAVYFTEEDKNPHKNLPRSLFFGIVTVMLIYVMINIGLIAVLPLQTIAGSILPAADVAQKIFGRSGDRIVTVLAIVFLVGILNASVLITPRILYAISKAGLFFKEVSTLNKNAIPGKALIISTVVAVTLALTGVFNLILNVTVLFAILVDLLVYISIFFARRKYAEPATYKAWGYPFSAVLMILVTLGLVVGLFFEDTLNCIYSLIILTAAFIVYFLFKKFRKKENAALATAAIK